MDDREHMLRNIHEGMPVYSADGSEIGKVEFFHFPEGTGEGMSAAEPSDRPERSSMVDYIGDAFRSDNMPDEERQLLLMNGFIHVDSSSLFSRDRYIMMNDVASVEGDAIRLAVTRDDLTVAY